MKCACGCNALSAIAVVAGLSALGIGGYNAITTGCPLGLCRDRQAAVVTPAAPAKVVEKAQPKKVEPALAVKPGT